LLSTDAFIESVCTQGVLHNYRGLVNSKGLSDTTFYSWLIASQVTTS